MYLVKDMNLHVKLGSAITSMDLHANCFDICVMLQTEIVTKLYYVYSSKLKFLDLPGDVLFTQCHWVKKFGKWT